MLDICLNHANYFVYRGNFYKQNLRMFMGSSLAPILVERVFEDIVDRALEKLELKDTLNSFEPTVQFTVEIEKYDKTIDFLDTTILNMGNKLRTKMVLQVHRIKPHLELPIEASNANSSCSTSQPCVISQRN